MARRAHNTNLLGRLVECTALMSEAADRAGPFGMPDIPAYILRRHQPCEVVGVCREDGNTLIDVSTPEGIVTVLQTQCRLVEGK